jgi:hypothetical protein
MLVVAAAEQTTPQKQEAPVDREVEVKAVHQVMALLLVRPTQAVAEVAEKKTRLDLMVEMVVQAL